MNKPKALTLESEHKQYLEKLIRSVRLERQYHLSVILITVVIISSFSKCLIKNAGDKIRLVLDNLKVHKSEAVKTFLATVSDRFEFVFAPLFKIFQKSSRRK